MENCSLTNFNNNDRKVPPSFGSQVLSHPQALAGLSLPFNIGGMLGGWVKFCWFRLQSHESEGTRNEVYWQERAVSALVGMMLISNLSPGSS